MNIIVGAGPVGILVAALLQRGGLPFRFLFRDTDRAQRRRQLLERGVRLVCPSVCPELHGVKVSGEAIAFEDIASCEPRTLLLCTPHTQFASILTRPGLAQTPEVVMLNSALGSSQEARVSGVVPSGIWTFSNFFGAAKLNSDELHLKALKKAVYLGGAQPHWLADLVQSLGVEVRTTSSWFEAELRNITLYVHTVLGLSPYSLEAAFGLVEHPRYLYKLFPEGPLERRRCHLYAAFFEDVSRLAGALGADPFNLLAFLHRDNYPVADCFLSDAEVDSYDELPIAQKGDLLYARYTGLLVDSKSVPDSKGRYFDFSAVPIERISWEQESLRLPRIVDEELYHITLLRLLASRLRQHCPAIDQIWREVEAFTRTLPGDFAASLDGQLTTLQLRARRVADSWDASR